MAGTNQAVNLGGMLSQIGNTLSSGYNADGLTRNIENMSRPDVAPDDIEGKRRLMDWQQQMGREEAARTTATDLRYMESKQKEERELNLRKSMATASNMYREAVLAGDATKISAARVKLAGLAETAGMDAAGVMAKVDSEVRNASIQQAQLKSQQEAEQTKKELQEIDVIATSVLAQYGAESDVFKAIATNNPLFQKNKKYVDGLVTRDLQLKNARQENADRENYLKTPPSTEFAAKLVNSEDLTGTEIGAGLKAELEAINTEIEAAKTSGWATPASKQRLENRLDNLQTRANTTLSAIARDAATEDRARVSKLSSTEQTIARLTASRQGDPKEVERIARELGMDAGVLGYNQSPDEVITEAHAKKKPELAPYAGKTYAEAAKLVIAEEVRAPFAPILAELRPTSGLKPGDVIDGMVFLGGDANSEANWKPVAQ